MNQEVFAAPKRASDVLPVSAVQLILAAEDEGCDFDRIGYYDSIDSLAEKVRSSKWWSIGEIFVFAEAADRFIVMKQIAPESCEMLTITHHGSFDVLTAYMYEQDDLVKVLAHLVR